MAREFFVAGGSGRGAQVPGGGVALVVIVEAPGDDGAVSKEDGGVGAAGGKGYGGGKVGKVQGVALAEPVAEDAAVGGQGQGARGGGGQGHHVRPGQV